MSKRFCLDCLTDDFFWCVPRYSDFVVHEINKQGKIVHLDDLSIPADVAEVSYLIPFQSSALVLFATIEILLIQLDPQVI